MCDSVPRCSLLWCSCVVWLSVFAAGSSVLAKAPPAFPGAEGFGAMSIGGRGGQVLVVTTLRDYVPGREKKLSGSLRAAVDAKFPRTIVFAVAGTIELKGELRIDEPFVTIAGQSAPGEGICLRGRGVSVRTHDVVLRYLRVRVGDEAGPEFAKIGRTFEPDGISIIAPATRVVVDHCSVSWAIDEVLSVSGAGITDITVQHCIISESLTDSLHSKGKHGFGSLLRCNGANTVHHNLYAHHSSRSPRPGTYGDGSILLDFRNNVLYDTMGYSGADPVRMNYVGNYIKRPRAHIFQIGGEATHLYVAGNILDGDEKRTADQWSLISRVKPINQQAQPYPVATVTTTSAAEAYQTMLQSGGASLPQRDAVDKRVLEQVRRGTGELINSQRDVGGWPELKPGKPAADADNDGMPDQWEKDRKLNPRDPQDASTDRDGDGYTNIEEFLNSIAVAD